MRIKSVTVGVFIILILFLSVAFKNYAETVYASGDNETESTNESTLNVPDDRGPSGIANSAKKNKKGYEDFVSYALATNQVINQDDEDNAVQKMRENKLGFSDDWYFHEGWRELPLIRKRTLVTGAVTFLNLWLKETLSWNEREKVQYELSECGGSENIYDVQ